MSTTFTLQDLLAPAGEEMDPRLARGLSGMSVEAAMRTLGRQNITHWMQYWQDRGDRHREDELRSWSLQVKNRPIFPCYRKEAWVVHNEAVVVYMPGALGIGPTADPFVPCWVHATDEELGTLDLVTSRRVHAGQRLSGRGINCPRTSASIMRGVEFDNMAGRTAYPSLWVTMADGISQMLPRNTQRFLANLADAWAAD